MDQQPPPASETGVVRQIHGEKDLLKLFSESQLVTLYFYADWCLPCKLLKPALKKESEASRNFMLACIHVDHVDNYELGNKFGVTSIPAVFLCHKSLENSIFKFFGNNIDKLQQMITQSYTLLGKQPRVYKLKNKVWKCPQGHDLNIASQLPSPYPDNSFQCDICKNIGVASQNKKMLHCATCNYDVCHTCSHD